MSHRLQVLIPEELDTRIRTAAKRDRVSKGEWVRRAIQSSLRERALHRYGKALVSRLGSLRAPTGDIDEMLAEVERGRR